MMSCCGVGPLRPGAIGQQRPDAVIEQHAEEASAARDWRGVTKFGQASRGLV